MTNIKVKATFPKATEVTLKMDADSAVVLLGMLKDIDTDETNTDVHNIIVMGLEEALL